MTKFFWSHWFFLVSLSIVVLAALVRFYGLGAVPHGMTWDEAAIGYNGHAILTTRRDEWLVKLPVSFRSFGDYKAPAAIYINGLFTGVFGLNLWAVRLPFALSGILAVAGMILLVKEWGKIFGWSEKESQILAIIGGLILATSPWHIHYSRAGFESGMSLTLIIWSIYLLLRGLKTAKLRWPMLALGALASVLNIYMYHSAKIVVPLLGLTLLWQFRTEVKRNWRQLLVVGLGGLLALYPIIKDSLYGKGLERASTLIVAKTDSFFDLVKILFSQFFAHLSPTFLVMGETQNLRHGDGHWGIWLAPVFFLILLGFASIFRRQKNTGWWLAVAWVTIGILPAALGADLVPHSNRSLLALPGFLMLALIGLKLLSQVVRASTFNRKIEGSHGESNMVWVSVMGTMLLWHSLLFTRYIGDYFHIFAKASANDFADGYLEAFDYVKKYEKDIDKIVFTSDYGQPYIFALFARKTNPIWYQGGSLIKYEFKDVNVGDLARENAIVVASQKDTDLPAEQADKLIYGSDGEIRFKIYLSE